MKRLLVIISLFFLLCGCGKESNTILKKWQQKIEKLDSYTLKGTMTINSNEDTFTYSVDASKSKDGFYKVSLINNINNHEQIILKNKDGVFVVTPDLNKSLKFQSDWPNNGSQSYLLDVLLKDVKSDESVHIEQGDKNYIQCRVNYPNNKTLYSEKIYIKDNLDVSDVEVLDQDNNVKISLKVDSINYNPRFDEDYFLLETMVKEEDNSTKKNDESTDNKDDKNSNNIEKNNNEIDEKSNDNQEEESSSNILKDIVYPLYIPTNTHLNTEDTINTDNGKRAILTFSGDSPFVLIEEVSRKYDELEIIPVNGEPILMSDTIGALSSKSLYWTSNGIDYYLSSNTMSGQELTTIAEGLTGTSIIVSSEK